MVQRLDLDGRDAPKRLKNLCESEGFFYLDHHGVDWSLVRAVRDYQKRFFELPLARKQEIHFAKASKQRGYIPIGAESTDPAADGDVKEALDFTFPVPPSGVSPAVARRMYGPNLWPADLPGFKETIEAYFDEMIRIGRTLFEITAESFDLPRDYFRDKTDRPIAQLRLLRYPPRERALGIGAHCDYECFTVLEPGEASGLQIQDLDGNWLDVEPMRECFVVNLGEMLARWTNDHYRATRHRVLNRSGRERLSIPFFFATNYDAWVQCLPPCESEERPARYPPIQAGEYLSARLTEIYGD